jgi:hypothetical protein
MMSRPLNLFFCLECDSGKFATFDTKFTVDDLFYCFKCQGYTDNRLESA